jgi:spore coat polysaccharide biosynthesis protein SpsF
MNISNKKVFIFITVRTSSSRLPNKCLKKINNKKIIEIVIQRAKKIGYQIILLTTKNKSDDTLCNLAKKNKIMHYRGSTNNVLKRWYDCMISFNADIAIIVDADDLLFDYDIYKIALKKILTNKFDYIKANENSITGLFTYIFNANVIKKNLH